MSLRLLLTLAGGLEILAGSAALIIPATGGIVAASECRWTRSHQSWHGSSVRGCSRSALACLKARHDVGSPAGVAVSIGITAYNVLAAVVLIWAAAGLGLGGLLLWGAGIGHATLGALFVSALFKRPTHV